MKNISRKLHKHNNRWKKKSRRMRGGNDDGEYTVRDLKKMEEYLKKTIEEKEKKESEESRTKILDGIKNLAAPVVDATKEVVDDATELVTPYVNEAIVDTTEATGDLIGMDPENKAEVAEKLDDIKEVLNDPVIKEKATEIVSEIAENTADIVKAAEPATEEVTKVAVKNFETAGKEIGSASVKIGLNMIEEIPGFGALVALARSADTAVKAGLKVADATSEVVEASSDAVKDTIDKLEEIKEEKLEEPQTQTQTQPIQQQFGGQKEYNKKNALKQSIMKHVGGAIKEFRDSTMNPYKIINRPSIYTKKRKNKNKLRRTKKRI